MRCLKAVVPSCSVATFSEQFVFFDFIFSFSTYFIDCQFPICLFTKPISVVNVRESLLVYLLGNSHYLFKVHWVL